MIKALIWIAYLVWAYIIYRIFKVSHDLAIGVAVAGILVVLIRGNRHRRTA